jgi:hypothetical protein
MCLAIAIGPVKPVFVQSQSSAVDITEVLPSSMTGTVGSIVTVLGSVANNNDAYRIFFDQSIVASGTAVGYDVAANFYVPPIPSGTYSLTLVDTTTGASSPADQFTVTTNYVIDPIPSYAQEGNSVVLNVTVTGGNSGAYVANVSVVLPSPLSTDYIDMLSLGTSNANGTANAQVTFPNSSFQPNNSTTDYAGSYTLYFNQSEVLALNHFSVGFLDSTTYHRGQTVTVQAIDYQPDQTATLNVTSVATGATLYSESLNASSDGIISTTWVVPSDVAIGDYNVTITPQGIQKPILDSEIFSVSGYPVQIETVNLADEVVPQIQVQALDQVSSAVYNGTTGSDGMVVLNLEAGSQTLTGFWNGVNVGETNITVTGAGNFTLQCKLTDLKIMVQNENGVLLPFVNLAVSYTYQPTSSSSVHSGNASGQTDPSGTYTFDSVLTGISYSVNASLYSRVFNAGNNTINDLPVQALSEVVIMCPNETLTINVVGYNHAAIPDARIDFVEVTNGLFYTATTDSDGSATSQVTFGRYQLQIYKDNFLINETNIEAFNAGQIQIRCTLYGIQVSVSVVDFFGQPISNANVTLNGQGTERLSALTQGDGTTTFNNVIGGNMQIVAFAPGAQNDYQAVALIVYQPTSVQVRIDSLVDIGSLLIQVSLFMVIIIILVAIILFVVVELYLRRRVKHTGKK